MSRSGGLTAGQAATLFSAAWRRRFNRDPSLAELDSLLSVSRFDGSYGSWPDDSAMRGSRNLGAIQCKKNGADCSVANPGDSCAPLRTWEWVNGQRVDQTECFRTYATWDAAADDFLREMTAPKRPLTAVALRSGSLTELAGAMRREHYFTAPADAYARNLAAMAERNARDLGRPSAVSLGASSAGAGGLIALALVAAAAWILLGGGL